MNYSGDIYGRVGNRYLKLTQTTEDVERLEADSKRLQWLLDAGRTVQFWPNDDSGLFDFQDRREIDEAMQDLTENEAKRV